MIKVGSKIILSKKKFKRVSYKAVEFDADGWADASLALPIDGDLMFLKVKGIEKGCGWIWGKRWEGIRLKAGDVVSHWKRNQEKDVIKDERQMEELCP